MSSPGFRVGLGFDVHPFITDDDSRPLVLGGVLFENETGLEGHSDSDVISHALADAMLGAAGLGDLGTMFPASDPSFAGADSIGLLSEVAEAVRGQGWVLVNADVAVVLERPKLAPHRPEMERRLSEVTGGPVRVAPKRAEGMGSLGRSEGVAAWAVALVSRIEAEEPG